MKNIHLIPTDKPSRLLYSGNNKNLLFSKEPISFRTFERSPQNIYITNDEEIKEGDWVVTPNKTIMLVTTKYATESSFMIGNSKHKSSPYYIEFCRKIILTTDEDLIKDGVQAIDDKFLEWFINNPNCEFVPIIPPLFGHPYIIWIEGLNFKEEPNQEERERGITITHVGKQETLENYIKEVTKNYGDKMSIKFTSGGIKLGAKWQAERMYSEEEVQLILSKLLFDIKHKKAENSVKWFEQFKKK